MRLLIYGRSWVYRCALIPFALTLATCEMEAGDTYLDVDSVEQALTSHWSNWTTDGLPPLNCENGSLVSGARCRGRYCDDVSFKCEQDDLVLQNSIWTDHFSEEGSNQRICSGDGFVTGLWCTGKYCDNVAINCTHYKHLKRGGQCYWSHSISEENGGTYEFPQSMYLAGVRCEGRYCDNLSFYLCEGPTPIDDNIDSYTLAKRHAPVLRFDSQFGNDSGKDSKCFPSDPGEYYEERQRGVDPVDLCNQNYPSIQNGDVPVFYMAERCANNLVVIRYWYFYAWQSACFTFVDKFGHHAADWESMLVRIEDNVPTHTAFFQHGGWYTKEWGHFETIDGTHPVAFVGKNAHGSYHDSGGKGGCLYWDDYRKPGSKDMRMYTENNLLELYRGKDAPEWMNCKGDCFDGIGHPIEQTGSLCSLAGCGKDGCGRSDVGNRPY